MKVGILDILAPPTHRPAELAYRLLMTKQFASITPQAISVWCRRQGHETHYATYYGVGAPHRRLPNDLRYLAKHLPGTLTVFHDANFAVKFDEVFETIEAQPPENRPPYIIESSLTVLRGDRPRRLKETNCVMVAPGVESWTDYSNKAGLGRAAGVDKVDRVADHFAQLAENVPYLQANFMFGLDTDEGNEPIELTKRFMDRTPFTWPTINIPVPFGGTPLHDQLTADGRILTSMPFSFYYAPYLVTTLKNYDPVTYYEKLVELYEHAATPAMLQRRLATSTNRAIGYVHRARTAGFRADIRSFRRILHMLRTDPEFLAFHEGRTTTLPPFYHQLGDRMLGRYRELLSAADRTPDLSPIPSPAPTGHKLLKISSKPGGRR